MTRHGWRAAAAHLLLICAGLAIVLYPLTLGANPSVSCRGVQLRPGQSCTKADGSAMQTYAERRQTALAARPVVVGVGLLVTLFGVTLLVGDRRTRRRSAGAEVEDRGGVA